MNKCDKFDPAAQTPHDLKQLVLPFHSNFQQSYSIKLQLKTKNEFVNFVRKRICNSAIERYGIGRGQMRRSYVVGWGERSIGWSALFRILMNWSDEFSEYNWSQAYRPNDSLNDFNDHPDPYPPALPIDLEHYAAKIPRHNKPEVTTGDGLELYGVLFDSHDQLSDEIEISSLPPSTEEKIGDSVAPSPIILARPVRQINISNSTLCNRMKKSKGQRFQTKNLCKHLHTQTGNFLKRWAMINGASKEEIESVRVFCGGSISIDNFKVLFKNSKLSSLCRNYYQSKYFVQEFMESKMDMKTKFVILKYLDKICSLTYDKEFKSWKDKELP